MLLGATTISSQRTVAQGSVVEFCLEYKIYLGTNTFFSRHKYILFCFILTLVFAKAQHSRPFSPHPPKLLILQSAIPPEQAVDRTFSDQQHGRPTVRRHNRKTTPSFSHPLTFTFPWSHRMVAIVVVDLFSSLSHRVGAMRRRACFKCGSATLGHSSLFCFATVVVFARRTSLCECALMLRHSQLSTFQK